jgi:hypothetical protein
VFYGNNRRPAITCCCVKWLNTEHSDGTETWRIAWIGRNTELLWGYVRVIAGVDPHFLNLDIGWRWESFTPRPLYRRKRTPVPIEEEAGLAGESVWPLVAAKMRCLCRDSFPQIVRLVGLSLYSVLYRGCLQINK